MTRVPLLKHKTLTCSKILNKFRVIWTNNAMCQISICLSDTREPIMPHNMLFKSIIIVKT